MGVLLVEMFGGNQWLCLRLLPSQLSQIVGLLARTQSPVLLRLLSALVCVRELPLKRNQTLVVKFLLGNRDAVACLIDSDAKRRQRLLLSAPLTRPEPQGSESERLEPSREATAEGRLPTRSRSRVRWYFQPHKFPY